MNFNRFSKKGACLSFIIGGLIFSQSSFSEDNINNTQTALNNDETPVFLNSKVDKIISEMPDVSQEKNPFNSNPLEVDNINTNLKVTEARIKLAERQGELDLLPLKQKLARTEIEQRLTNDSANQRYVSSKITETPSQPQITEEQINARIQKGIADQMKIKKNDSSFVSNLSKKSQTVDPFKLKMITKTQNGLTALLSNEKNSYTVKQFDRVGNWSVIDIVEDQNLIILGNGKVRKTIKIDAGYSLINLSKNNSNISSSQVDQQFNRMPNPDLPLPPKFN